MAAQRYVVRESSKDKIVIFVPTLNLQIEESGLAIRTTSGATAAVSQEPLNIPLSEAIEVNSYLTLQLTNEETEKKLQQSIAEVVNDIFSKLTVA